jgi:hypothetical protein
MKITLGAEDAVPHAVVTRYTTVDDPAERPVNTPVTESIVATDSGLLLQRPPVILSAYDAVEPTQTADGPVNGGTVGVPFTLKVLSA